METEWFYHDGAQRQGPVTLEQLLIALTSAPNPRRVLVWRAGLAEWTEAGSVPEVGAQLPPPLPAAPLPDPRYRAVPVEEVEGVARLYRRLVLLVGLQILLGIVQISMVQLLPMSPVPEAQWPLLAGAFSLVLLGVLVAVAFTAYHLTLLLDMDWPPLWAIAMFIPCLNILGLLALSARAQDWCRRYGIKVGFLGPTEESLEELRRRMSGRP